MEQNLPVTVTYSVRGIPTYRCEVSHEALHKYAVIKAGEPEVLAKKALAQLQQWNAMWEKLSASEQIARLIASRKDLAIERTTEAQRLLDALRAILVSGIELDPTLDWDARKVRTPFSVPAPGKPEPGPPPVPRATPPAPALTDYKYQMKFSLFDRLMPSRKQAKFAHTEKLFDEDTSAWTNTCAALSAEHSCALEEYGAKCARLQQEYAQALAGWNESRVAHQKEQEKQHTEIDQARIRYVSKAPEAVIEYCERVLSNSDYPECIPREFDFDFNPETGILAVNCRLPAPEDLPRLAEVKYVKTTDSLVEKFLSETQLNQLYSDVLHQITLRSMHELFQSDSTRALSAIVFNGIVTSTDRSTGNEATVCLLSVQASRDAFLAINLTKVDPKACFRQLKGVGSSKLHSITPIAPILELKRDDRRFVPSYGVAERLNEGHNLAVIDWEDFEHLIREIFEKEFSYTGGEVKVTQASRDGGVDAVAFDPDPIRGGKIVIQAKRYAYTVGVSAVRDLYGTVLNEGASKGILVTTSDYGPDAYDFARGKPITLLSGSNLLHLLAKHGVKAHINLTEARKLAHDRSVR